MAQSLTKIQSKIEEVSSILLSTLDESLFFSLLDKNLRSFIDCDHSHINLVLDDGQVKLVSVDGEICKEEREHSAGVAGHVVRTKRPYFSNSIDRDPIFASDKNSNAQKELIIPISHDGIVLATAHFRICKLEKDFSRDDISSLNEILSMIKQPIANMKMYLSAKHLNESLLKRIEEKEIELKKKSSVVEIADTFKIQEKEIIGKSAAMKELLRVADKVASCSMTTLITGEKGVGKEMIARRIHCRGDRKEKAFVTVDCSILDELSLEKELFGFEGGDFKNIQIKKGALELAHEGTLFINNVEKLTIHLQNKLKQFISEGGVACHVNGQFPFKANVRIIVASSSDLKSLSEEKKFSEDFYSILSIMTLKVPSLKERKEDIETLANYFLNKGKSSDEQKSLSPGVVKSLEEYSWGGNVRELQNIVERAYILSDGRIVEKSHISEHIFVISSEVEEDCLEQENEVVFGDMTLTELEKRHICATLDRLSGNKTKTAKTLGITVKTLYNKLHSYGMIDAKEA